MLTLSQLILISLSLVSLSRCQFLAGVDYPPLIAKSDIFYMNPINDGPNFIRISDMKEPFQPKSKDIKIIIHGHSVNSDHVSIQSLRFAYLASGHDAVFAADWSAAATVFYLDARYFVRSIGMQFGKILDAFMRKNNIEPSRVHILGHSLGSHIAGNIGRYFNGTIGRITGLDPAGPLFEKFVKDGLLPRHAKFVDCIHTDTPILGQTLQRGHVDFYPNAGYYGQPGCELIDVLTITACSHIRAVSFYAESIQLPKSFPSFSCPLKLILKHKCDPSKSKTLAYLGENLSPAVRGTFYLQTNNVSPFGRGKFSKIYLQKSWAEYLSSNQSAQMSNGVN